MLGFVIFLVIFQTLKKQQWMVCGWGDRGRGAGRVRVGLGTGRGEEHLRKSLGSAYRYYRLFFFVWIYDLCYYLIQNDKAAMDTPGRYGRRAGEGRMGFGSGRRLIRRQEEKHTCR